MLKLFNWDLNVPSVETFASYYVEFVVDEMDDFKGKCAEEMFDSFAEFQNDIKSRVVNLVDHTIFGINMIIFPQFSMCVWLKWLFSLVDIGFQHNLPPSKVAAMCCAAVRYQRNMEPIWPEKLQKITQHTWDEVKDFAKLLQIELTPRERLEAELLRAIHQESRDEYLDDTH